VQEEIGPQASLGEDVVLGKVQYKSQGDVCRCYMKITSVDNAPEGGLWQWYDITDGNQKVGYFLSGQGNAWDDNGTWTPFPSSFEELDVSPGSTSSAGVHTFEFRPLFGDFPDGFTLNAKIHCYLSSGSSGQQLINIYTEAYELGQGDPPADPINNPNGRSFTSSFSCFTSSGEQ